MKKKITRREVLGAVGIAAGAGWLGSCVEENISGGTPGGNNGGVSDPGYTRLDPDVTAEKTYQLCSKGHCMYGAFAAIVVQLGGKLGEPYQTFPCEMMVYGRSGVCGWGSLCGALNGSAAAVGLICRAEKQQAKITDELFRWYEKSALPIYVPTEPVTKMNMSKSIANSVLCHNSCTNWSFVSEFKIFTEQQKERCRRLTADVAKKTVEILNAEFDGKFQPIHKLSAATNTCRSCHAKPGEMKNTRGKMDCASCHWDIEDDHHDMDKITMR